MTVPLSNGGAQSGLGLTQSRAETNLGAEADLDNRDPGARRDDAAEMAMSAAFAMHLARARATAALNADDENDMAVVAAPPPPPVIFGLDAEAELDPAIRRSEVANLAQSLISQVEASDRIRLGGNGPVSLTLPLDAKALGLTEAKIVVAQGELTIIFPTKAGVDPGLVNAALGELAQALTQRFPNRAIRLRSEDDSREAADPAEFNPLKEPVGRRT